ncbi:MAG: tetratricopeptide repeat protein [Proteobacteria bacterium]|nr:tetratricopeptide repeat protein [Pseudomonadota bacterium]
MAKKTKPAAGAASAGKRRAKAVIRPAKPKVTVTPREKAPAQAAAPRMQTVDADKMEIWRSLPEDQRNALREREAVRLFQMAAGQHRDGALADAVRNYGKSLLLNPRQSDVYNNMGVALRALGNREAAVACYRRALVLRPNNAGVYSNMGNALRELGRLEVAQASHQQAVACHRKATRHITILAWCCAILARPRRR